MGERGAIVQMNHRVDDRLRVDHNVDLGVRNPEEVVGLDQLQALVDQRRRVDRNLAAHLPGGMRKRLLASHLA